jgi:predicted transposase YbfD/YdcC
MNEFGEQREAWLSTFLELPSGIPSSDTFGRVLSLINPSELGKCLSEHGMSLFKSLSEGLQGRLVNFDGKKIKGENPRSRGNKGLYILSAWISDCRLSIGQTKVEDKSNELTAIPKLLDELDLAGSTVSIDAIGCQVNIATKIKEENKAEYLLAVKKNQKGLLEEIEDGFTWKKSEQYAENWDMLRTGNMTMGDMKKEFVRY